MRGLSVGLKASFAVLRQACGRQGFVLLNSGIEVEPLWNVQAALRNLEQSEKLFVSCGYKTGATRDHGRAWCGRDAGSVSREGYTAGRDERLKRDLGSGRRSVAAETIAKPKEEMEAIAVLAFQNASGDPDSEYLSDGIAEELINNLSQMGRPRNDIVECWARTKKALR